MDALQLPDRMRHAPRGLDGMGIGDVEIKEVEANDFHFYEDELQRIGLAAPAVMYRVVFSYHHVTSVKDVEWRAMLGMMAVLARDTHAIVYAVDAAKAMRHDFGR